MALDAALLASAGSAVLTVLTKAGALLSDVQSVEAFVVAAVQRVETSGKSGADKLTMVLNATEAFVANALPTLKVDFGALSLQVKGFVAGVVSLFNAIGVFVKDVANDVKSAAKVVGDALGVTGGGQSSAVTSGSLQNSASPPAPAKV